MHQLSAVGRFVRGVGAGLILLAAGCGPVGQPQGSYRDAGVQIASKALFEPARFAGDWHVVAAYGAEAGCGPLTQRWTPAGAQDYRVSGTDCGRNGVRGFSADARISGPGRISSAGQELWVLWVDADYRVAVIGTPDGHFGRILARGAVLRPDLMAAAREVLDFNGYDLSRLMPL